MFTDFSDGLQVIIYGGIAKRLHGSYMAIPAIKKIIIHDPATIIFWGDGTKTVVKAHNEPFDPEKGVCVAICKKLFRSGSRLKKVIQHSIEESK